MELISCTAGPIQGNLFWFAEFPSGSETRFARNDGGNAELNPPYNEITLEGVTDYYTEVTRGLMNGDLFTNFNTTLAFDILKTTELNITKIWCGSQITISQKIVPFKLRVESKW